MEHCRHCCAQQIGSAASATPTAACRIAADAAANARHDGVVQNTRQCVGPARENALCDLHACDAKSHCARCLAPKVPAAVPASRVCGVAEEDDLSSPLHGSNFELIQPGALLVSAEHESALSKQPYARQRGRQRCSLSNAVNCAEERGFAASQRVVRVCAGYVQRIGGCKSRAKGQWHAPRRCIQERCREVKRGGSKICRRSALARSVSFVCVARLVMRPQTWNCAPVFAEATSP